MDETRNNVLSFRRGSGNRKGACATGPCNPRYYQADLDIPGMGNVEITGCAECSDVFVTRKGGLPVSTQHLRRNDQEDIACLCEMEFMQAGIQARILSYRDEIDFHVSEIQWRCDDLRKLEAALQNRFSPRKRGCTAAQQGNGR